MTPQLLTLFAAFAIAPSINSMVSAQSSASTSSHSTAGTSVAVKTDYAPVNRLRIYYEIHGQGEPLFLLHGGITATQGLAGYIKELSKTRQVIAPHAQGHGHTADIDRPYQYESLADDVAAVAKHLGLPKIDVVGYSFGGGIALQTAIRHPDLVARLVVIGAAMARDGLYPEIIAAFEQMPKNAPMIAANVKASPLAEMYPKTNWEASFKKMGELHSTNYDWTEQVELIRAPTQLIFADADVVRVEHVAEFYRALGGGQRDAGQDGSLRSVAQLAIVPGATHYDIVSNSAVASLVNAFLEQKGPANEPRPSTP